MNVAAAVYRRHGLVGNTRAVSQQNHYRVVAGIKRIRAVDQRLPAVRNPVIVRVGIIPIGAERDFLGIREPVAVRVEAGIGAVSLRITESGDPPPRLPTGRFWHARGAPQQRLSLCRSGSGRWTSSFTEG